MSWWQQTARAGCGCCLCSDLFVAPVNISMTLLCSRVMWLIVWHAAFDREHGLQVDRNVKEVTQLCMACTDWVHRSLRRTFSAFRVSTDSQSQQPQHLFLHYYSPYEEHKRVAPDAWHVWAGTPKYYGDEGAQTGQQDYTAAQVVAHRQLHNWAGPLQALQ